MLDREEFRVQVAGILGVSPKVVDDGSTVSELNVDSVTAAEIWAFCVDNGAEALEPERLGRVDTFASLFDLYRETIEAEEEDELGRS